MSDINQIVILSAIALTAVLVCYILLRKTQNLLDELHNNPLFECIHETDKIVIEDCDSKSDEFIDQPIFELNGNNQKRRLIDFRLEEDLIDKLNKKCTTNGVTISRSSLLRLIVSNFVNKAQS